MRSATTLFALILSLFIVGCKSSLFSDKKDNTPVETGPRTGTATPAVPPATTAANVMQSTAMTPITMNVEERLMVDEINNLRKDPRSYLPFVKDYIQKIRQQTYLSQETKDSELSAARELLYELSRMAPMSELKLHEGLYQMGIAHGKDLQVQRELTHRGANGSYPWDRVKMYSDLNDGNENLVGGGTDIRESVMILLVDAGIPNRGHRMTLLNPNWEYVAAHKIGKVGDWTNSWIQVFGSSRAPDAMASTGGGQGQALSQPTPTRPTQPNVGSQPTPPSTPAPTNNNSGSSPAPQPTAAPSTPGDFSFMSSEERAMIEEINLMRSNPKAYIQHVNTYLEEYKNAGWDAATTQDEITTAQELIRELNQLSPLSVLQPHRQLYEVAKNHGQDMKRMGSVTHTGSNGSSPFDRIEDNTSLSDGNENLVGGANTVRESVIMLLVDSGIPSRGHRRTLLNPKWNYVATYKAGEVGAMPNTWVQNFGTK